MLSVTLVNIEIQAATLRLSKVLQAITCLQEKLTKVFLLKLAELIYKNYMFDMSGFLNDPVHLLKPILIIYRY